MTRRQSLKAHEPSQFNEVTLTNLAKDMQSGRFATQTRFTVSDDMVTGLRAVIYKSGMISFAVSYHLDGERPFLKLGSLNKGAEDYISVAKAREIAKTVKALADKGIDVQAGLHLRLIRELDEFGTDWRPDVKSKTKR